ncbi:MAG: hypothetical protein U1E76_13160 [Planctomycetota bacterium]
MACWNQALPARDENVDRARVVAARVVVRGRRDRRRVAVDRDRVAELIAARQIRGGELGLRHPSITGADENVRCPRIDAGGLIPHGAPITAVSPETAAAAPKWSPDAASDAVSLACCVQTPPERTEHIGRAGIDAARVVVSLRTNDCRIPGERDRVIAEGVIRCRVQRHELGLLRPDAASQDEDVRRTSVVSAGVVVPGCADHHRVGREGDALAKLVSCRRVRSGQRGSFLRIALTRCPVRRADERDQRADRCKAELARALGSHVDLR